MGANTEPTVWPKGCYRLSRVGIISVFIFWPDMADIHYQSEVGVVNE